MYPFELPPLPWPHDALSSVMSPQTIDFHYGKHHKGYVDKLNELVKGKPFREMTLEQIILETAHKEGEKAIFNNAAQVWNHTFFWNSLNPRTAKKPSGDLEAAMDRTFGTFDEFKTQFKQAALDQFGSGWVWLCSDHFGKVQITKSANALNPLTMDLKPLLTIDVWEHAYYLDFQNRRGDFVEETIDKLLNWEFAEQNFEQA
jgi:Fe-Mn family superoxide dismutase